MTLDPAALLAIGGPSGIISAMVAILIKVWFDSRRDKREQQASDVQTDSAILENAKRVIELVRNETDRIELKMVSVVQDNKKLEDRNRRLERRVEQLQEQVVDLRTQRESDGNGEA